MRRGPPPASPGSSGRAGLGRFGRGTVLLVIGIVALAFNLRAAITSLPPVFPELSASLRLSSAALAVLASVPLLCFGVFSAAGAPLSRWFGEERVLEGALAVLAVGLLLRGVLPGVMLFPGTALAAAGIALMNVLLPSLVKRRDPARAGWLIGIYLLSLSAGSIVSSLIAIPVYRASDGSARLTLGLWALPAIAAALAWLPQWRYRAGPATVPLAAAPPGAVFSGPVFSGPVASGPVVASGLVPSAVVPSAVVPGRPGRLRIHRHALTWQVTAFFGLQSLAFYAALSWLPTMFRDRGASAGQAGNLLALMNFGGALAVLLIPVLAHRAPSQRVLIAATTGAIAVGLAGVWFAPLAESAGWILVLGFGQGASLSLAVYFTMARAPDPAAAASLSAFAQGVGYLVATAGPLVVGFLHAATGSWTIPIVALLAVTGVQLAVGMQAARARTIPGPRPAVPSQ
ncbi:MAG: transporter, family, cyanate transporter [Streptosporangiaceae bacterium]|nr:transporter, family, cyanate transporter [Streptosporangiaceae bacterium]